MNCGDETACTAGRKTATAEGNGAANLAPVNRSRPRRSRTSEAHITPSCHQAVSVRAGTSATTVAPVRAEETALAIQRPMLRPYGGFIQHVPRQARLSPVLRLREEARALGVLWRGTDVHGEGELSVEPPEERPRRRPVRARRRRESSQCLHRSSDGPSERSGPGFGECSGAPDPNASRSGASSCA